MRTGGASLVKQADAANLAREMTNFYVSTRGEEECQENQRIHGAVFYQLFEFVPENAVAALIHRDGDGVPVIAALHNRQLYLLEVFPEEGEIRQPATECQMVHVEPGGATVAVRTRYAEARASLSARSTTWRFEFNDGPKLTIETQVDPDGEIDRREALARALAAALGWQMDLPTEPDEVA
jgi:hypothetical protein